MRVHVHIDDQELRRALRTAERHLVNLRPAWAQVGEHMLRSVDKNFDAEGRPTKWEPLNSQYAAQRKPGKIMTLSARLRRSITYQAAGTGVVVGTNVIYARILQEGGRTRPHTITARRAKALKIPGIGFRKSVRHPGSNVPARPYLMTQDEDLQVVGETLVDHIVGHWR